MRIDVCVIGYPRLDDRGDACACETLHNFALLGQVLFRSLSEGVDKKSVMKWGLVVTVDVLRAGVPSKVRIGVPYVDLGERNVPTAGTF